ncbi:MAG: M12 family metallo-peptidase [Phycisphaerales bacterium]
MGLGRPKGAGRRRRLVSGLTLFITAIIAGGVSAGERSAESLTALSERLAPVDSLELIEVGSPVARHGELFISTPIEGEPLTLRLTPSTVRSPEFRVTQIDATGAPRNAPTPEGTTYRGWVEGDPSRAVAASVTERGLTAIIVDPATPGAVWTIEPAARYGGPDDRHVAYYRSDSTMSPAACGVDHDHFDIPSATVPPGAGLDDGSCMRLAEIAFDVDFEYYQRVGSSVNAVVADVEAVMNAMEVLFARDLMVQHEITEIIVRTGEPDPYTTNDPGGLLNAFRAEWNTNQSHIPRDMAHFITGREMDGGIIGLAYVGVVCNTPWAYGLSQFNFDFTTHLHIARHELGHNWGSGHCHDAMCDVMCGNCEDRFSPNAIRIMMDYRNAIGCLDDPGPYPSPIAPRVFPKSGTTLASEPLRFDVLDEAHDANCEPLDIQTWDATSVNGGTIALSPGTGPNGRDELEYVAAPGFEGTDSFTYTIEDTGGLIDTETVTVEVLQYRAPDEPTYAVAGLHASYYHLGPIVSVLPDFDTLTPYDRHVVGAVNWPSSNGEFATSGEVDYVGAVFEGYLEVPADDIYTLSLESDDGSALVIDGRRVVDNDGLHGMREVSGLAALRAGLHFVRIEFFESVGTAGLIARIEGGGLARQIIPAERWLRLPELDLLVEPLVAGRRSTIWTIDAPPDERVYFAYSRTGEGSTYIPELDVTLDLDDPRLLGSAVASNDGLARLSVRPPSNARNTVVWLQSTVRGLASDVELEQIN